MTGSEIRHGGRAEIGLLRSPASDLRQGIASRRRHVAPALLLC